MTLTIYVLCNHNLQRLYTLHNKNLGFCPKIDCRGPCLNTFSHTLVVCKVFDKKYAKKVFDRMSASQVSKEVQYNNFLKQISMQRLNFNLIKSIFENILCLYAPRWLSWIIYGLHPQFWLGHPLKPTRQLKIPPLVNLQTLVLLIRHVLPYVSVSIYILSSRIKIFSLHFHFRGPILKFSHDFIRSCQTNPLMVVFSSENLNFPLIEYTC